MNIVPWGFRNILLHIQQRYAPPGGIYITENGCPCEPLVSFGIDFLPGELRPKPYKNKSDTKLEDFSETYDDPERVRFLTAHLAAVHAAREQGADVRGYFCWS